MSVMNAKGGRVMNSFQHHLRLVVLSAVMMTVRALWSLPAHAETDTAQPTLKAFIEKRSKEKGAPDATGLNVPDDPLGRGTPRSSVRGFLSAAKDRNYVQAAEYLDLRNLPPGLNESQGPELARELRIVLDRTLWIDMELLSTNPEGDSSDNL